MDSQVKGGEGRSRWQDQPSLTTGMGQVWGFWEPGRRGLGGSRTQRGGQPGQREEESRRSCLGIRLHLQPGEGRWSDGACVWGAAISLWAGLGEQPSHPRGHTQVLSRAVPSRCTARVVWDPPPGFQGLQWESWVTRHGQESPLLLTSLPPPRSLLAAALGPLHLLSSHSWSCWAWGKEQTDKRVAHCPGSE